MPKTPKKPKGKVTEVTEEAKDKAALESEVSELKELVQTLVEAKEQDEEIKEELRERLEREEESSHPDHGPGPACEAYKIHKGEALQLKMSQEPGVYEPVPSGFKVRNLDGIAILVKAEHPDNTPIEEGMTANCRSMYTEEYPYLLPKRPGDTTRKKAKAPLCRHHAKVLLGVSEDQKASGLNEVKE